MDIILQGGPLDGRTDRVPVETLIYRRSSIGPNARYQDSGVNDATGRRIFEHTPLKPGDAEQQPEVYDA